jgi:hypothetical protein
VADRPPAPVRAQSAHALGRAGRPDRGVHGRVRLDQPGAGRRAGRHPRRSRPVARRAEARSSRGAGDPLRAPERGTEAGVSDCRQPARPASRMERGAAGARAGLAQGRKLRSGPGRLRCHRARAAAGARGGGGWVRRGRGRGPGASGGAGQQTGRPLDLGPAPPAVRQCHGARRCRAGAGRAARGHDLLRSTLQRRLCQHAQGQAPGQEPADPERQPGLRLRGVPAGCLHQPPRRHQGCGVRVHVIVGATYVAASVRGRRR